MIEADSNIPKTRNNRSFVPQLAIKIPSKAGEYGAGIASHSKACLKPTLGSLFQKPLQ
jgi:hypothetical protein